LKQNELRKELRDIAKELKRIGEKMNQLYGKKEEEVRAK